LQNFCKGGAAVPPEKKEDVMSRAHREHKCDKARCRSDAHNGISSPTTVAIGIEAIVYFLGP